MADPLFPVRNNFWLGAYQTAISEASHLTGLSEAQKIERDVLVYRSYIELGTYEMVLSEIGSSSPAALQAVRLLAVYLKHAGQREQVLGQVSSWLTDPSTASNPTVLLMAALIYALEQNEVEALRIAHNAASLELLALAVQLSLGLDRPDQAERALAAMAAIDDDATLTQLATAWVGTALGGAKVQEAFYVYQELGDKFVWTARLHTGLAACQMRMARWEDAESELLQAFEKNPKDGDALANLAVVSLHLGKNAGRYLTQLKAVAPSHALVRRSEEAEAAFERAAAAVAV